MSHMVRFPTISLKTGQEKLCGIITDTTRIPTDRIRTCLSREISGAIRSRCRCDTRFKQGHYETTTSHSKFGGEEGRNENRDKVWPLTKRRRNALNSVIGASAPARFVVRKTKQGGNDDEGFVSSSNRGNVVADSLRFARSRFCQGRKDFQGKVRWLLWRGRCRQTGGEIALDQGQEYRRNHQGVL